MIDIKNPFQIRILLAYEDLETNTAAARAVRKLKTDLEDEHSEVIIAEHLEDAQAVFAADPSIQCVLMGVECQKCAHTFETLKLIRERNAEIPIFVMSSRNIASQLPIDILNKVSDFIWLLEDTSDFISGRVQAAIRRYREFILPPMFKALSKFAKVHEYSWHTPGHTGGTAFLKSNVGRDFFNFYGEQIFRSDLSISVAELGSMLDHTGPIGASEKYISRVFNSSRSYHITNGSSTSNRVILMASVTRNQICLCDRNCHKSVEHAMTLSGAVPTYLVPLRNQYGIIGPIPPERLTKEAVKRQIDHHSLVHDSIDHQPKHAIITNSTYDGLCYNVTRVRELLGESVDRLHFDEAWYGYARFNPLYRDRYAMCCDPKTYDKTQPTIFATQSTHKLLAAFSQASMIHVLDGRNPIDHTRFNESLMMHASTSPFYAIIASNDISAAMMDNGGGRALTDGSLREAVTFRQTIARIYHKLQAEHDWFFNIWHPDFVTNPQTGERAAFYEADPDMLMTEPDCWVLHPSDSWHGFGALEDGYCMLDPIKVSVITPGMTADGTLAEQGIPASVVSAYLDNKGIIVEKTTDFTILFLFSLGITKGKWGTLLNALFEFKTDFDANAPIERVLPKIYRADPTFYRDMGLKDLAQRMFHAMKQLKTTKYLAEAFSVLPHPDLSPVEAYEKLVKNDVESLTLDEMAGRTVATGVVPYPPGIPLLMPGENAGPDDGPVLGYLKALEAFDSLFTGFTHETHGVSTDQGRYKILCLKQQA
jgi:arginine/lysine/ornithine decarboxylase